MDVAPTIVPEPARSTRRGPRSSSERSPCTLPIVGLLLVAAWGSEAAAREVRAVPVPIPDAYFAARLAELGGVLRAEEVAAFEGLTDERARLAFLDAVWDARDPTPGTPRNEARAAFEVRVRQGLDRLGAIAVTDPEDARLRVLSLLGEPDELLSPLGGRAGLAAASLSGLAPGDPAALTLPSGCPTPPVELFVYFPRRERAGITLVVVRTERGWRLDDGGPWIAGTTNGLILAKLRRRRCQEPMAGFVEALEAAIDRPSTWDDVRAASEVPEPSASWIERLRGGAAVVAEAGSAPPGARAPAAAELTAVFTSRRLETTADPRRPGRQRRDSVVDVDALLELALPTAEPGRDASTAWSLRLRGEVFEPAGRRSGVVVRRFERDRLVLARTSGSLVVPLTFSAPSGGQLLVLRVDDVSGRLARALAFELEVPLVPDARVRAGGGDADGLLARLDRMPTLRVRLPDALLVGERPVQSITRGDVTRVEYRLDGEPVGAAEAPPFEATLDFGILPLERGLEAVGFDAEGREVASDRVVVNPGLQRLRLDLVELTQLPGAVRARARLVRPVGSRLDRVEWYVDERRLAISSSEPLTEILPIEEEAGRPAARFVRAVARLEDGRTVEDTRFLASDALVDRVEVDLVQLFVGVTDRRGRQIEDLEESEVRVLERGAPQQLRTFERATELPLQLALLVDVSGTMNEHLELVRAAATAFLERVLGSGDQGAILTFRSGPEVIAPFGPAPEWVSDTLSHFQAWGGTALWDSLALTAYYAQGLPGKKAVVVVTDGDDRHSELTSSDVEELAQRLGVAVYVIGVGIAPTHEVHLGAATVDHRRPLLTRLCENTGGLFFPIRGPIDLGEALETIEADLRSQYVLTFQSDQEGSEFRRVRVEVSRAGARATTTAGYYP